MPPIVSISLLNTMGRVEFLEELRNRVRVFRDRDQAGRVLAGMLGDLRGGPALVLAIPAGGVPVAAGMAGELGLDLDLAVVSKITPGWNTEVGYGAVAFDGSALVNESMVRWLRIDPEERERGVARTRRKVARRLREFRGTEDPPDVRDRPVVLVDDGLASGVTMEAAVLALGRLGAGPITVAVPTAHGDAARRLAARIPRVVAANLREGTPFAVADAYANWYDVGEDEVREILGAFRGKGEGTS